MRAFLVFSSLVTLLGVTAAGFALGRWPAATLRPLLMGLACTAAAGILAVFPLGGNPHRPLIVFTLSCLGVMAWVLGTSGSLFPPSPRGVLVLVLLCSLIALGAGRMSGGWGFWALALPCMLLAGVLATSGAAWEAAARGGFVGHAGHAWLAAACALALTLWMLAVGRLCSSSDNLMTSLAVVALWPIVLASGPLLLWVLRAPGLALAALVPGLVLAALVLGDWVLYQISPRGAGFVMFSREIFTLNLSLCACLLVCGAIHGGAGRTAAWLTPVLALVVFPLVVFALFMLLLFKAFSHGSSLPRG